MMPFTPGEMADLQLTQDGAMMDTCVIVIWSQGAADTYGKPKNVYTPGDQLACGFNATARREVMDGAQVAITDAQMRLPIGTEIGHLDQVQVTHRHGVRLSTPLTFAILGEPRRGASGLLLNLRSVT